MRTITTYPLLRVLYGAVHLRAATSNDVYRAVMNDIYQHSGACAYISCKVCPFLIRNSNSQPLHKFAWCIAIDVTRNMSENHITPYFRKNILKLLLRKP